MSKIKELNYFTHGEIEMDKLYYRGNTLIKDIESYRKQFDCKNSEYLGESSVSYLFYPNTAQKIHEFNPDAKILIFLRNPVERAFSHYLMDYNAGYIKCSLEYLLNNSIKLQEYQQVVQLGCYYDQVKKYLDLFKDNVSIHIFEEWIGKENQELKVIEDFLGLPNYKEYNLEKENSYFEPSNRLLRAFNRNVHMKSLIKLFFTKKSMRYIKQNISIKNQKPVLNIDIRRRLYRYYMNDINKLSELLSQDLSKIWNED